MTNVGGTASAPYAGLALLAATAALLLAGCLPADPGAMGVRPTLVSVQVPTDPPTDAPEDATTDAETDVVLQGRYLTGAGASSDRVVVGANAECAGGRDVTPTTWTTTRIVLSPSAIPASGFVCVIVDGVPSNALPLDLD
ncbi:MAG: hypothetical protein RI554_05400 [Trueperaceae bacterium]|nr:hypothetical protein [Trueperaceae bacterium]